MIKLRPYQINIINKLRNSLKTHRMVCVTLPTGAGKGFLIGHLSKLLFNNNKSCWNLVHRYEILDQLVKQCIKQNVQPGQIISGKRMTANKIQCGMLPTVYSKLKYLNKIFPDVIQLDEFHHSVAKTHCQVINSKPETKVIGWTATPKRLDGIGIKYSGCTKLITGTQTIDLVQQGYLCNPILFSSPIALEYKKQNFKVKNNEYDKEDQLKFTGQKIIIEDTIVSYKKYFNGNPCIIFCVSIKDCELIESEMNKNGWKCKSIHNQIPLDDRKKYLEDLENGKLNAICSYQLLTEGVDIPILYGVIIRRLTKSLTVYLQMCGRVMRHSPGKKQGIIIDSAGNYIEHQHPLIRREWSLDGSCEVKENENEIQVKQCPFCGAWLLQKIKICTYCGELLTNIKPQKPDRIKIINSPLQEIKPPEIMTGKYAADLSEIMEYEESELDDAIIKRIDMIKGEGSNAYHRLEILSQMFNKSSKWTRSVWDRYFKE